MAKHWSATSIVVLALLGCLVGTNVEAQGSIWQPPAPQMSKGAPPPQAPKVPPHPQPPQVLPLPLSPKDPQNPQAPKLQPAPWPNFPQHPQAPKFQPAPPANFPQHPQPLQPAPQPNFPQHPQAPKFQPAPPANFPQNPQAPKLQPAPRPNFPQHPQPPKLQPASPANFPQHPQPLQPAPRPNFPQHPQPPKFQPASLPNFPQNPQAPKLQPAPPANFPQHQQAPKLQPAPPANFPQHPQPLKPAPQPNFPQHPQPPILQPAPRPNFPQNPQAPKLQPAPRPNFPQNPQAPKLQPAPRPNFPQHSQAPKPQPVPVSNFPQNPQAPKYPRYPQPFRDPSPQEQQVPAVPQIPSSHKASASKQTPAQSCEVAENVRVPCGGPGISPAACEAINCCFDGQHCYFGKAVTIQCTKDAEFIVVVAKDATLPNIDLETISLLEGGQGCTHVDSNSDFAIYHFPVTACGSIVMEEPGVIIYENRMSSSYEVGIGPHGAITRDSYYELHFQCRYIGTSVETVVAEVLPLQDPPLPVAALGPIRVHLRLANGQCYTKGCNEVDVAYSSFYTEADYPVIKVLRDPVYVEVQLIEKTDPNLVLTLGRCWTTTSPNPHSMPQWDILTNGCPWTNDRYMSSLVPVGPSSGLDFPSHYRRFIFKMFTFVDTSSLAPLKEQVYIHCSTAVCTAAMGHSCEPSCFRRKRDVETPDKSKAEPKVVVSVGPVIMTDPKREPAENVELKKIPENI